MHIVIDQRGRILNWIQKVGGSCGVGIPFEVG